MTEGQEPIRVLLLLTQPELAKGEASRLHGCLAKEAGYPVRVLRQRVLSLAEVVKAIGRYEPEVVHFCGALDVFGDVVFQDDARQPLAAVGKRELFSVLQAAGSVVPFVYFNGRVTIQDMEQASAVSQVVLGMKRAADAGLSQRIALPFYRGLCSGESVRQAFDGVMRELAPAECEAVLLAAKAGVDIAEFRLRPSLERTPAAPKVPRLPTEKELRRQQEYRHQRLQTALHGGN